MRCVILPFTFTFLSIVNSFGQNSSGRSLLYLSEKPPALIPAKFAPGIVSVNNRSEFGSVFSKDGKTLYFAIDVDGRAEIRFMKLKNNTWTNPERLIISDKYSYNDQFLSPDENRIYFISDMPLSGVGENKDYDIWYIQKEGDRWSKPINAGNAINSGQNEYYISFTKSGTMYYSSNKGTSNETKNNFDIYASAEKNGKFQESVKLSSSVNTKHYEADVFVAYDESYLIFCGDRPEGYGRGDLYISFKNADGTWTEAKNMGPVINTDGHELCPFVTKDGRYFFYTSNKDIYWVDAKILNQLK